MGSHNGKIEKDEVKAQSLGEDKGVNVSVSAGQLKEMGLDPNGDIRVDRYVFPNKNGEMRLRMRDANEE